MIHLYHLLYSIEINPQKNPNRIGKNYIKGDRYLKQLIIKPSTIAQITLAMFGQFAQVLDLSEFVNIHSLFLVG